MSNYWKSLYDTISRQFEDSLLKQVGRTLNGEEVPERQVELIVDSIVDALKLDTNDSVVDLCCGNGLITRRLAMHAKEIVGVDFSTGLIDTANRHSGFHNIRYICADVLELAGDFFAGRRKVVMYEALQHFSEEQLANLLHALSGLEAGSLVFLGGIPDRDRLTVYYDTQEKLDFYTQREREGRPHMGRWWLEKEIRTPASTYGFEAAFLPQKPALYKSYYCFDVLLERHR